VASEFRLQFLFAENPGSKPGGVDLSSWRAVINCSEPVRFESHQAFYERFKSYGLKWEALQCSYAMAEKRFRRDTNGFGASAKVEQIDREALHDRARGASAAGRSALPC